MITKIYRAVDRVDGEDSLWAVNEYGCAVSTAYNDQNWESFEDHDDAGIWEYNNIDYFSNAINPALVRIVETSE